MKRMNFAERLARFSNTQKCWNWRGFITKNGYGSACFWNAKTRRSKSHYVHRRAWELLRGQIPEGLVIDHLCRNRRCMNPSHMEVVTQAENIRRGTGVTAHNSRKNTCPQGHPYDVVDPRTGFRKCSECMRQHSWRNWKKKQGERKGSVPPRQRKRTRRAH